MEYDKTDASGPPLPRASKHQVNDLRSQTGHLRVPSQDADVSVLAQPLAFPFSGRTASNRFLKGPMTERLCRWNQEGEDISARGFPTPEYIHLYQRWAEGHIGIIVAGNMMIQYDAVEAFGNPILVDDHDGRVAEFRKITDLAHQHGSLIISQLSHPGRQGGKALNPRPVSASEVQLKKAWGGNEFAKPRALTVDEIAKLVKAFGESAYLCWKAGFDGVQVHAAHGYLLAQFLSPTTNQRTDSYGGSLEHRARFLFEVISECQSRVADPKFIICVKLNSVEFQDRGMTSDEARQICLMLDAAKVDFVDLSGGTFEGRAFHHVRDSTKKREAYFIEFAETIRPQLSNTKVYVTGGLRSASGMVKAIADGACDGVGLARPLAAEPYLCRNILQGTVTGAIETLVPLPLNTQASGTQIHQIGKGEATLSDWSVESEVKRWEDANEKETERRVGILPKVDSSGYPYIKADAGYAYLTAH